MSYFSLQPYCFLPKLVGRFRKNHPNMNQTPPLWYYSISIFMKPNKGQSHKPLNICIWLLACKVSLSWLKVKDKTQPPQCHLKIPGNLRRSPSLLYGKSMTSPSEHNSLQIMFYLLIPRPGHWTAKLPPLLLVGHAPHLDLGLGVEGQQVLVVTVIYRKTGVWKTDRSREIFISKIFNFNLNLTQNT